MRRHGVDVVPFRGVRVGAGGVLAFDERPALYGYEWGGGRRGIIGAVRLTGAVVPHEDVAVEAVEERVAFLRAGRAQLEPVLLGYRGGDGGAAGVLDRTAREEPALLDAWDPDGVRHRLWAITGRADQRAVRADLGLRQALIADGHHRWAAYRELREVDAAAGEFGLALLVDTGRHPFAMGPIHRVLPGLPLRDALAAVAGLFRVRRLAGGCAEALEALDGRAAGPEVEGSAFVVTDGRVFHLLDAPAPGLTWHTVRHDRPARWRELDATVLRDTLLGHLWKMPAHDARQVGHAHDAGEAVRRAGGGTAVLMRPVGEDVVRELAQAGVALPWKSTSFEPKPLRGLVFRMV
ncbi:DUF1015 family protein [Streptomyces sp. DH8]|uniref:DUF1015 family protein n=1 Tax=Streptomyces sp. DH8 TaxID=2857008 RepID=UPI001E5733AB|nr:DUF1015 family protein [Streptomyces sp. DH8]